MVTSLSASVPPRTAIRKVLAQDAKFHRLPVGQRPQQVVGGEIGVLRPQFDTEHRMQLSGQRQPTAALDLRDPPLDAPVVGNHTWSPETPLVPSVSDTARRSLRWPGTFVRPATSSWKNVTWYGNAQTTKVSSGTSPRTNPE